MKPIRFPQKTLDCLRLASFPNGSTERDRFAETLIAKYGWKVVERKMERLSDKDYIDFGVTAFRGWLTEKGKRALDGRL